MRRAPLVAALVLAILLAAAAPSAATLDIGISDQQASSFQDARLTSLGLRYARLIVPWDAATSEPAAVQAWVDAVAADGMQPHIASSTCCTRTARRSRAPRPRARSTAPRFGRSSRASHR